MKIKAVGRIRVVLDEAGRMVATAPAGGEKARDEEPRTTAGALPGQTVVEVALPKELERLLDGPADELHEALSACTLRARPASGVLLPAAEHRPKG